MATKTNTEFVAGESRNGSIGYPTRGAALAMWEAFGKAKSSEIDSDALAAMAEKNEWSLALARFHLHEWKVFTGAAVKTPRAAAPAKKKAPAKKAAPAKKKAAAKPKVKA